MLRLEMMRRMERWGDAEVGVMLRLEVMRMGR